MKEKAADAKEYAEEKVAQAQHKAAETREHAKAKLHEKKAEL